MELIKMKSFELATFSSGDKNSEKLALLLPGRLDTKDYVNFVSHAEYLAGIGFFVVAFDPPGTWESLGGIELFTTTNYLKAVGELIEHFGNRPTLLLGHSRGAITSILATMSNPSIIGVVSVMANFRIPAAPSQEDVQRGYKVEHRDIPPGNSKTDEQKVFNLPIFYWEDGKQYNTGQAIKTCTKPKLLVYGTKDEFTSPEEVKELYKTILEPKIIKELNCTHDYRYYPEAIEEVNKTVGQFLDKYSL